MRNPLRIVSEQIISSSLGSFFTFSGIRSSFRVIGNTFWPKAHPRAEGTVVNYDLARQIYRNSGDDALGSAFAKPIVDLQVAFIGIPTVKIEENETLEDHLNECIKDFWAGDMQEMFKSAIRDGKVIVRLRQPDILDPLMTMDEATHYCLEVIPPERVDIQYSMRNKNVIEQVQILHRMIVVTQPADLTQGLQAIEEEHDVIEVITKDAYRFYDQNTSTWLDDMRSTNSWNFVPVMEVFNEWDAALQGGQSDFESVIPFLNAFHDVVAQGLQAHRYHSTPKIKLKISDVTQFIKNNFPDAIDEMGQVKQGASVNWQGREILFFNSDEDAGFLEARSVLGDTKTLADFLIDCIAVASQTPEWAFMRVDSGSANSDRNAQTVPFLRKIQRKRTNFQHAVQQLCKMAAVAYGEIPYRPSIIWDQIRPDDQLVIAQAFQQMIMGLEVAAQRGEISDETYMETIRSFLPMMGNPAYEKAHAIPPPPPALPAGNTPAPSSSSQPPQIEAGKKAANA